jgi:hypothetical protein
VSHLGVPYSADFDGLCIYLLWRGDQLLYVGQTAYLSERFRQHQRARDGLSSGVRIPFDRCTYIAVEFEDMNTVETLLMDHHQPPYNQSRRPFLRPRYVNMPKAKS